MIIIGSQLIKLTKIDLDGKESPIVINLNNIKTFYQVSSKQTEICFIDRTYVEVKETPQQIIDILES